jgi:dolichyl-phosphate-mannose-protein mannosyltransferase
MTSAPLPTRVTQAVRSYRDSLVTAWASSSPIERAITVMLGLMIVGGVWLRIRAIGYPPSFTFDEPFFVPNAHNYLLGVKDSNDHPPLFKLFMSLGILLFGFNAAGWRYPALCFGILSIVLAYHLAKQIFRSSRAGFMAAAFIAADGFFISYSRVGLMDGILTSMLLWCMLSAFNARTWRGVLVTALLVGFSASVKWNAVFIAIPASIVMLWLGRVRFWSLLLFAIVPVVQTLVWLLALKVSGEPANLLSLWQLVRGLLKKHVDMNRDSNPLNSSWYAWFIFYRPVVIKFTTHGVSRFYSTSLGNPVFWIAFDLVLLWTIIQSFARATAGGGSLRDRLVRVKLFLTGKPIGRQILWALLAFATMMAPWTILRNKYSFQHYYLPPYSYALIALGGIGAYFERRRPRTILVLVGLALAVAIFYAPVWGEFSLKEFGGNLRLVFPGWRP